MNRRYQLPTTVGTPSGSAALIGIGSVTDLAVLSCLSVVLLGGGYIFRESRFDFASFGGKVNNS